MPASSRPSDSHPVRKHCSHASSPLRLQHRDTGTEAGFRVPPRLWPALLADTVEGVDHIEEGAAVVEVDRDEVGDAPAVALALFRSGEQHIACVELVGRLNRAWA